MADAGGTETLGAVIVQLRANSAQFTAEMDKARTGLQHVGEHAVLSARSLARFGSIALEQVMPGLQGSRLAMEGLLSGLIKVGSGFGTLALVAGGAAAVIGGALYLAFYNTKSSAFLATEGVKSLDESIQSLTKNIDSSLSTLGKLDFGLRTLRDTLKIEEAPKGMNPLIDIIQGALPFLDRFRTKTADNIKAARDFIRQLEGAKLLEDPAAGPGGKIAQQQREAAAKAFFDLEKAVKAYVQTAGEVAVTDPLEKMLIADFKRTQELIDKIRELPFAAQTVTELEGEIADRAKLIGELGAAGGRNQIAIRDATSKAGAAQVATSLGLGPTNLLTGFGDIEKLEKDIAGFRSEIDRLTRLGVPARDLFDQIAEGQQKVDDQLQIFKTRFADSPALLARVLGIERGEGGGSLQRSLDATVRGFNNLKTGSVQVQDAMGNLIDKTTLAAEANNFLASILNDDVPKAADAASQSVVIVTGKIEDLARAVANARFELGLLVGTSTVGVPTAPGNF